MANRARGQRERRDGTGNRLLDALPHQEFDVVRAALEEVRIDMKEPVYEQGMRIAHVHFPVAAVISLVSVMDDGSAIEAAIVGKEGMVGIPVFLEANATTSHMAFGQIPGPSLRMEAGAFREALDRDGALRGLLQRYTQALFSQVARNAACNRAHPGEQRMARWLLQTHDRVGADTFPLTQEFLSEMLGVTRGTVNAAARGLQERGLIEYTRGNMTILDRKALERTSCECYRVVSEEFRRLLP